MAQRLRLATQAVNRGERALRRVGDAMADGHIDAGERVAIVSALQDWLLFSKAANTSQALGHALDRGVADVPYLTMLFGGYQSMIDELPEDTAA